MLCEPQLGKRGLYADLSKFNIDHHKIKMIMMDFISWCDGEHTLLEISEKLNVPIWELYDLCNNLEDHEIISITSK
jgi:aminopeptidase-like protein